MIDRPEQPSSRALLFSGGLDSAVLAAEWVASSVCVQPIYVQSGFAWEKRELAAAERFWNAIRPKASRGLVVLASQAPRLAPDHWARSGLGVPTQHCDDRLVDLPGRNADIIRRAALWCQQAGISQLAIATLGSTPFADATPAFFCELERRLAEEGVSIQLLHPFSGIDKATVLKRAAGLTSRPPLELTLSCLSPISASQNKSPHDAGNCGTCNKCGEREAALRQLAGKIAWHARNPGVAASNAASPYA